jgi:hypothetical protein
MATGNIRYGAVDENLLRKSVRNFNDKLGRILKANPEAAEYLPAKRSIREERKKVQEGTRSEFKQKVASIQRFSQKGAEKIYTNQVGLKTTQYQVKEAKKLVQRENIKRAQRRKLISTDVKKGLAIEEEKALQKKKEFNINTKNTSQFNKFVETLEGRLSSKYQKEGYEKYKENYLKGLRQLGVFGDKLAEKIANINPKELYLFTKNDADTAIDFIYGHEAAQAKAERIAEKFYDAGRPWSDDFHPDIWNDSDDYEMEEFEGEGEQDDWEMPDDDYSFEEDD